MGGARQRRQQGRTNGRPIELAPTGSLERPRRLTHIPRESAPAYLVAATLVLMAAILFAITPYTHFLDEIKNTLLLSLAPLLLFGALWFFDFSRLSWRTHWPDALLGLFACTMLVSIAVNPGFWQSSERTVWFQISCLAFAVAFAWHVRSAISARRVMIVLVGLMLAAIGIGLVLYACHGLMATVHEGMQRSVYWRAHPDWIALAKTLRDQPDMHSTILNPDFFAAFLVMLLFVPLSVFFAVERLWLRIAALATFLLGNICVFFANSNDSFLALALVGYPLYAVLVARHMVRWRLSRRFVVTAAAGCAMIALTVGVLMLPTLAAAWDFKAQALDGRKILWLGGLQAWLFHDDPTKSHIDWMSVLFGTGPGGYRLYFPLFRRPDWFDNQINNVTTFGHNWYVDVLCEYGLAGLLAFLGFLGAVMWNGFRQVRRAFAATAGAGANPRQDGSALVPLFQAALMAGLGAVCVQNFFSPNNRWAVDGMVFWGLLGLSVGLWRLDLRPGETEDARAPVITVWPRLLRMGLVGFACVFAVRSIPQGIWHFDGAAHHRRGDDLLMLAQDYDSPKRELLLDGSRKELEAAIHSDSTSATSYYKLGSAYSGLNRIDDAIETYRELQRIDPHYSEVHLNLGMLYRYKASQAAEPAQALADMETAHCEAREAARESLKPDTQATSGAICQQLAALYHQLGRKDDALRVLEEARTHYRNIVDYTPRIDALRARRDAIYGSALSTLISLSDSTGHHEEAGQLLRRQYDKNPADTSALAALLGHYDRYGKPAEKEQFLREALQGDPLNAKLRRLHADTLRATGDIDESRRELERAAVLER